MRHCFTLFLLIASSAGAEPMAIRAEIEQAALLYFTENANPTTGLVLDKALSFPRERVPDPSANGNIQASIAATGFGLAIQANAVKRGQLDRAMGEAYFNKVMRFARDKMPSEHGFFLHWMDWQTGASVWDDGNEFSSIDSAFFIAGALYAAQVFPQAEGAQIARELYAKMDFIWIMTDGGRYPDRRTLSLGYSPQRGFSPYQWSIFSEQMILVLLGMGSPTYPLPAEAWNQWERRVYPTDKPDSFGFKFVAMDMPLFVHQYTQLFVDLRSVHDRYTNYFANSQLATEYNRQVSHIDTHFKTLSEGFWGFSAGQAPGQGTPDGETYIIYDPLRHSSTVCIGCAIGSAMFHPTLVLDDAYLWRHGKYSDQIWGRFGFTDSVDLDQNWFSKYSLAITVAAEYLSLANTNPETSLWPVFDAIPEIATALSKIPQ